MSEKTEIQTEIEKIRGEIVEQNVFLSPRNAFNLGFYFYLGMVLGMVVLFILVVFF